MILHMNFNKDQKGDNIGFNIGMLYKMGLIELISEIDAYDYGIRNHKVFMEFINGKLLLTYEYINGNGDDLEIELNNYNDIYE